MDIQFREFNPFDLWLWWEFATLPTPIDRQYVEETLNSWYYLGKLGAFNAENLQVMETGVDLSYMDYDRDAAERALMAPMHNMSDCEYRGNWGRCWLDLGTSDPIALDILINALRQLSQEYVLLQQLIVGGQNPDWQIAGHHPALFTEGE
ncbi:MAG: DUF3531 family protein [Spirulinaceae cyanobacterium RM2_2_10]|nr:DUF3531 family protein [Spirulinaceae cyanobacterium SM2_1_0]NJO20933.1 DUF3531 family protein [Spirulinaceae cyanobacterium RM2_2_10]